MMKQTEAFDRIVECCQFINAVFRSWRGHPVAHAVRSGTLEDVRAFFEHGEACALARPDDVDVAPHAKWMLAGVDDPEDLKSWLGSATYRGDIGIARFLFEQGACVGNSTIFHVAAQYEDLNVINLLVSLGANINTQTPEGVTALMRAVMSDQPNAVRLLLSHGCNVNAVCNKNKSAISRCIRYRKYWRRDVIVDKESENILLALLEYGANPTRFEASIIKSLYQNTATHQLLAGESVVYRSTPDDFISTIVIISEHNSFIDAAILAA